jgi:hypothetical protein
VKVGPGIIPRPAGLRLNELIDKPEGEFRVHGIADGDAEVAYQIAGRAEQVRVPQVRSAGG